MSTEATADDPSAPVSPNAYAISPDDVQRTLAAVWRMEAAKVTAVVARVVGDVGLAEDLAQDAFVQALEQWPRGRREPRAGLARYAVATSTSRASCSRWGTWRS